MSRNQLDQETSPYLLLHKDDPVHWYAWGREALAASEASGKPILLSIGYTACHWCHVMQHESFADADTAAMMNDNFVNVKVDREERPDIDLLYQSAINNMGSQGGWPLTMFLTPKGVPFYAGTYFPKEPRFGQPPFKTVLNDVAKLYREQPDPVATAGTRLTEQLNNLWNRDMRGALDANTLDTVSLRVAQRFDIFFGGLTGAQKFPSVPLVELVWRAYLRTGAQQYLQVSSVTLDHMLLAGLYDHVGGGFYRYTTDERWLVPHFEKMANDNAQLIDLLLLIWQHNRNAICQSRIEETIGWLTREMMVEDAFATSLDADSEGEEGKYYLWSEPEIDAALMGTFVQKFKMAYGVTRDGNFQGRNILQRMGTTAPFPQLEADEALLTRQRGLLLSARLKRVPPMRDDKVLADTNGMLIAALINAGAAMKKTEWSKAAVKAFDFVVKALGDGDKLAHSWRAGNRGHAGFADDYAHMARAALALWEATGEQRFLDQAKRWVHTLNENFWDEFGGGYFFTSHDDDPLIVRARSIFDQTQPPANSVMLGVLSRLFMATSEPAYADRANRLVQSFVGEAGRAFFSSSTFFNNIEFLAAGLQIVIVGPLNSARTHELAAAVLGRSLPNRLMVVTAPDQLLPQGHPAHGKTMENGQPTAYVCQRQTCSAPITNPVTLSQMLQLPQARPAPGARPQ
jgi:uncharacterized protein